MNKDVETVRQLELEAAVIRARALRADGKIAEAAQLTTAIVQAEPGHIGALRLMGALAVQTGAFDIAIHAFTQAIQSSPRSVEILLEQGDALLAGGKPAEASTAFRKAIELRPRDGTAFRGLAKAQLDSGQSADALRSFRKALSLLPYDKYCAHMVAALSGETSKAAQGYVSHLFDDYAAFFDEHLTGTLQYRIPQVIHALVASHTHGPAETLLDLGCGTGLVGAAFHDNVPTMDGIDISRQMTIKAEARDIYRHLRTGDVVDVLSRDPSLVGPYDLVIAADVFIYVPDLDAVFAAISQRLAESGRFVFSVEAIEGNTVQIRSSGRFAHPEAYLKSLADQHGFTIVTHEPATIRQERNQPIPGQVYLLAPA